MDNPVLKCHWIGNRCLNSHKLCIKILPSTPLGCRISTTIQQYLFPARRPVEGFSSWSLLENLRGIYGRFLGGCWCCGRSCWTLLFVLIFRTLGSQVVLWERLGYNIKIPGLISVLARSILDYLSLFYEFWESSTQNLIDILLLVRC